VFASGDASNCFSLSLIRPLRALEAAARAGADLAVLSEACGTAGPDTERFEGRPPAGLAVEEEEEEGAEGLTAVPLTLTFVLRLAGAAITPSSVCSTMSGRGETGWSW
jgi:hypothetical protein